MKLNLAELKNPLWNTIGIKLPSFDIEAMKKRTARRPEWLHFGAGNIFRGFIAANYQELLASGDADTGIIAVETFDYEIIDRIYKPYDNLTINISASSDGTLEKEIVASIAEGITGDSSREHDAERLTEVFVNPSLKMVSFTVTEKGYTITDGQGKLLGIIEQDIEKGPTQAKHLMSILVTQMYKRFKAGAFPVALVSMDNCSHNGEKLQKTVFRIAEEWTSRGFVEKGFLEYLRDGSKVSFPWSMIDRITPRPSLDIQKDLEAAGLEAMAPIVTDRHTFIAPFVNAEETKYLFIENDFPNGSIPLDKTDGIWFTDRDTVNGVETMKVTTCLNPLHTAIAVTGCVLGYTLVSEAVKDEQINDLIYRIGYLEGLPVALDPGVISPKEFLDAVYDKRLRNPYILDAPQRITLDTSLKIGIRFGETIKAYHRLPDRDAGSLKGIALATAAWFRYLLAVDDEGNPIDITPDPRQHEIQKELNMADPFGKAADLSAILHSSEIFSIDLFEAGIAENIQHYFNEMCAGPGAMRSVLKKYL